MKIEAAIEKLKTDLSTGKHYIILSPEMFTAILDSIYADKNAQAILDAHLGAASSTAKNDVEKDIVEDLEKRIAIETNEEKKTVLLAEQDRHAKKIKNAERVGIRFILRYLVETCKNKAMSALADKVTS